MSNATVTETTKVVKLNKYEYIHSMQLHHVIIKNTKNNDNDDNSSLLYAHPGSSSIGVLSTLIGSLSRNICEILSEAVYGAKSYADRRDVHNSSNCLLDIRVSCHLKFMLTMKALKDCGILWRGELVV